MKKNFYKIISLVICYFCLTAAVYADDWEPMIFNADGLPKIESKKVKDYVKTNGTYLSGTDDFSMYFLKSTQINKDEISENNYTSIVVFFYKNSTGYLTIYGNNEYNGDGQINYSVLNVQEPVVLLKYVGNGNINTVVISHKVDQFIASSVDCVYNCFPNGRNKSFEKFNSYMEIRFKFFYLQGKKVLNQYETFKITTDLKMSADNYDYNHIFGILGIEGVQSKDDVYFQTYITDDKLRLRTVNTKSANVIKLLSKGTEVRIINVDPNMTTMEGNKGFWVLVETKDRDIGWIWSGYLNGFMFDFK